MKHRTDIQAAFESMTPTPGQKQRMLENILASDPTSAGKDVTMKCKTMKPIVIAAIIALMALLMGCAIAGLRLRDLSMKKESAERPGYLDENGSEVPPTEIVGERISLQGISDTPNQQATKEWMEYWQSYDPDYQQRQKAEEAGFQSPEEYEAYGTYTQEMVDKVDEIAEKYSLKLLGPTAVFQRHEYGIFFESLGLETLMRPDSRSDVTYTSGYFYSGGTFNINFRQTMTGQGQWPYKMYNYMYYSDKDYFDPVYMTFSSAMNCEEWSYTTSSGAELLIVQGESFAIAFYDREDAFVTVHIETEYMKSDSEVFHMTKDQLIAVLETYDFYVQPQETDLELARAKLEKFNH